MLLSLPVVSCSFSSPNPSSSVAFPNVPATLFGLRLRFLKPFKILLTFLRKGLAHMLQY